ncbi:MAG: dockerin type I repeat-containing protein, partial [Clostridiales bacterium]|nr:dockerin type I repeat-containing protein [Clostridiales bacterium]
AYNVNGEIFTATFKALSACKAAFTLPTITLSADGFSTVSGFVRSDAVLTISDYTPGDVNGDGDVDFLDSIIILRASAKLVALTDSQETAADINGDGDINFLDSIQILKADAGLI